MASFAEQLFQRQYLGADVPGHRDGLLLDRLFRGYRDDGDRSI